jgi:S-adenosylmethionine-diacylglycerol 3-amino-3-carboxypropyl transferase
MSSITKRAKFNFIRYANVWEDAEALLVSLQCAPNSNILSVASAGDNCFSLLTTQPKQVIAADINEIQLWLVELKRAAIKNLSYKDCLHFLGFTPSTNRKEVLSLLEQDLSPDAKKYFREHLQEVEQGIVHQGKFERYFQTFAKKILPLIHTKKTVAKLLEPKTEQEQIEFYTEHWNTWRWRLLFKIFFSKWIMGRLGRDPEFLNEVKIPVSRFIFLKAERQLKSKNAHSNYILRYNLTGSFNALLPHYLQPQNFENIKNNLHKLILFKGYAEEAIATHGPFHAMNLSNIFEYMPRDVFEKVGEQIVNGLEHKGRLVYWNLMVPRKLSTHNKQLALQQNKINEITPHDKGFFYHSIIIETKE